MMPARSSLPRRSIPVVVLAMLLVGIAGVGPAAADGVSRLAGSDRWATSVRISESTFAAGVDVAWVASGTDFADALTAGPVASAQDAPVLLTRPDALPTVVRDELRRLRPATIRIAGGTAAVTTDVQRELEAIAPVDRVEGANRYATAAAISRSQFADGASTVWIANGAGFADALSGAPGAARDGGPILLAQTDRLTPDTRDELIRLQPERIVVLGGTAAISRSVARTLRSMAPDYERLSGNTRWGTSARVATSRFVDADTVYIADGRNFPDALSAAAMAGAKGAPILLTASTSLPAGTVGALEAIDPASIVVLGGTSAVADAVALQLASHADLPAWGSSINTVSADRLGSSWRSDCPRDPDDLRLLRLRYLGFDGIARTGDLIVATSVADEVRAAFRDLYEAHFPIRRMRTVDVYGSDDGRSMAADNTSAFNCRRITGGQGWSKHSYGEAIDINPRENPYVRGSTVLPPEGRAWLDRDDERPGMLLDGSMEVRAFTRRDFTWGGDWTTLKDYQHLERPTP